LWPLFSRVQILRLLIRIDVYAKGKTLMDKKKVPVLVGVGQLVNREKTQEQMDPLKMMAEAGRVAARDAAISKLTKVDTLYVVNCLSRYLKDPCKELSEELGCTPAETGYTGIGATAPQWFVNRTAERIYQGNSELALICGAEAFYAHGKTLSLHEAMVDFFAEGRSSAHSSYVGDMRAPFSVLEEQYGLVMPLTMYSLMENALRAHWNMSIDDHFLELCSFCAQSSVIASQNPFAWTRNARTAGEIGTLNETNRMVAFPYTKLMCSNMTVNQGAALIMTNLEKAEALGIPKDKVVFLRGFADAEDVWLVSERPDMWASPSVRVAVNQALDQIPLSIDEVEYLDFYSCFPCAPRVTREMLGISHEDSRPLTITGGMPAFGGPGNNYAMHAICRMVTKIRENPDSFGLVQALSWYISKHSVGVYGGIPGEIARIHENKGRLGLKNEGYQPVNVLTEARGKARVESYTVLYDRDSEPCAATVIGREEDDNRFIAKIKPEKNVLEQMTREEIIGKRGRVEYDPANAINWFYL
jgi:acetyl-CoA C-acetyltransferase